MRKVKGLRSLHCNYGRAEFPTFCKFSGLDYAADGEITLQQPYRNKPSESHHMMSLNLCCRSPSTEGRSPAICRRNWPGRGKATITSGLQLYQLNFRCVTVFFLSFDSENLPAGAVQSCLNSAPVFSSQALENGFIADNSQYPPLNLGDPESGYLTESNLLSISLQIGQDWRVIGINLGLSYENLDRIQYKHR